MSEEYNADGLAALIRPISKKPGALLVALQAAQKHYGYVPKESVPVFADVFNLSSAEVRGVLSFYHDLRDEPAGKSIIKIC